MRRRRDFGAIASSSWMWLWLWLCVSSSSSSSITISMASSSHFQVQPPSLLGLASPAPAARSLMSLSPERSTALMAALDGTIHLVETISKRVIWSFPSGPPIYSSYQHNHNHNHNHSQTSSSFYIDCGHDWELYLHTPHLAAMKLSMSIEEYIKSTPYLSDDGAVTLGSKKTTVFEVDPWVGTLIRSYLSPDTLTTSKKSAEDNNSGMHSAAASATPTTEPELLHAGSNNPNPSKPRLQIMRTDYTLTSFAPDSDKVSWNMSVAEIVAALLCPGVDYSPTGDFLNSKDKLSFEISNDIALPLPCQSKAFVFRHRTHVLLESATPQGLPRVHDQDTVLHLPAAGSMRSSQPEGAANVHPENSRDEMLSLPPLKVKDSNLKNDQNGEFQHHAYELSNMFSWSSTLTLALFVGMLMGIVVYRYAILVKGMLLSHEQQKSSNSKASPSKKKKNRRLEKNSGVVDEINKQVSLDIPGNVAQSGHSDDKTRLDPNKFFYGGAEGRRVGKLVVSNAEIAKGSNGTVVFEGIYEGRHVAVKRLVQAHHDIAFKEIQNLIASDRHPNIVRWYGVECDQDFVYLSLERCTCSLDDLIQIYSYSSQNQAPSRNHDTIASTDYKVRLESLKNIMPKVNFWKANGHPSPLLLKLMRDVVLGLAHLHELGIIHRDLKPQNVLIIKERFLCAKLSDMGISKRLLGDMSSLGHHVTGCGSSGWQAPEQLLHGRQTRAVDLFCLGCILFFCISGGRHPFGDRLERDINIVKNSMDLLFIECMPEATDLISRLLNPDPELRPKASKVLRHPLFWDSETRLSFLRDTSDRVELEDRESGTGLLKALESIAPLALGGTKWDEKMEPAFIANIGYYRRYKFDSVRDLLRVMRNKLNHYRELPKEIQELVGAVPEGFDGYFASRFPRLLIEVYIVMYRYCKEEECFRKYYRSNVV